MKKWVLLLLIVFAFVIQMVAVMPSGSHYCHETLCGTYFWGAHEHDGIWHMALINSGLSVWPGRFPTFATGILTGYNALLDLVLRAFHLGTGIPALTLYFKIVPVIWFISMVAVWKKFADVYTKNGWYFPALLFFIFFGNSFSYFFRLYHEGIIWGASGLLSMQSPQMLTNIQFALTLPIIGLLLIIFRRNKIGWRENVGLLILNFAIMGLKFYGGIVSIAMSSIFALSLLLQKRWREGIAAGSLSLLGFGLATILFYNPFANLTDSAILSLRPLATVHPIIEEGGLIFAPSIANLRNNLYAAGGSWRLVLIEMATIALFVFFNWGTRIIGLLSIKRRQLDFILLSGIVTGFLMNILFTQRGEWWNTVQFLYYATFLSNIYAADTLSKLTQGWKRKILAVIIVLVTIPNAIDSYRIFSSFPPHSYVSDEEMVALEKLKRLPSGIVLALPLEPISGNDAYQLPKPLYERYDTAYVAAFSDKQTYLNDLVQLRLTGIDYELRHDKVRKADCSVLADLTYIYIAGSQAQLIRWQACQDYIITELFSGKESSIYRVTTETPNQ